MSRGSWSLMIAAVLILSGCGKQIEDYVKSGKKKIVPDNLTSPSISTGSAKALKISPGAGIAVGHQVQGKFSITPSRTVIRGHAMDARIAISQSRVE